MRICAQKDDLVVTAEDELYGFGDSARRIRGPHLAVTTGADAFFQRVSKNLISGFYALRGQLGASTGIETC